MEVACPWSAGPHTTTYAGSYYAWSIHHPIFWLKTLNIFWTWLREVNLAPAAVVLDLLFSLHMILPEQLLFRFEVPALYLLLLIRTHGCFSELTLA